jgi:hypothetical protein
MTIGGRRVPLLTGVGGYQVQPIGNGAHTAFVTNGARVPVALANHVRQRLDEIRAAVHEAEHSRRAGPMTPEAARRYETAVQAASAVLERIRDDHATYAHVVAHEIDALTRRLASASQGEISYQPEGSD